MARRRHRPRGHYAVVCAAWALASLIGANAAAAPTPEPDFAVLAASASTPAEALYRALLLHEQLDIRPERKLGAGVVARRVAMPEVSPIVSTDCPSAVAMLPEVLLENRRAADEPIAALDLLFRRRLGEVPVPFAVLPVPTASHARKVNNRAEYSPYTFLELGAYRFPLDLISHPRAERPRLEELARAAWADSQAVSAAAARWRFGDRELIAFGTADDRTGYFQWVEGPQAGLHPFVNLPTNTVTCPRKLFSDHTFADLADGRKALVVLPTVYNPARIFDDQGFLRFFAQQVRNIDGLTHVDNVVDLGSGSGYSTLHLWHALAERRGPAPRLHAVERNPIGALATALNLRAAGVQASVSQRWPEVDAAVVLANAPKFPHERELPDLLRQLPLTFNQQECDAVAAAVGGQELSAMHDGGTAGFYYWYKLMRFLGRHLNDRGVAYAWNIAEGTTGDHRRELETRQHRLARMAHANGLGIDIAYHAKHDFYDGMGYSHPRRIVGYGIERARAGGERRTPSRR